MISVSATEILEHRNQQLTEKNRRQLIRHLSEYLSSKFSKSSTAKEKLKQKQAVARATVFLFPPLKTKSENGGIVRWFSKSSNLKFQRIDIMIYVPGNRYVIKLKVTIMRVSRVPLVSQNVRDKILKF